MIFKALTGFGDEREVYFGPEDLERVQYAALREKRVLLSNGQFVDGKYIQQISPDYKRTMGWNYTHEIDSNDLNEIRSKGIDRRMQLALSHTKERVHYLIETKQEHLIGKNVPIPELDQPKNERREGTIKRIGEIKPSR